MGVYGTARTARTTRGLRIVDGAGRKGGAR